MHVFRFFESLLEPTAVPTGTAPPSGLGAFYWHYARQARHLVAALFVTGFIVAILDTTIPVFIGRVVTLDQQAAGVRLRAAQERMEALTPSRDYRRRSAAEITPLSLPVVK